ncbi:hypothetical protein C8R44DRAFT_931292 [Mycena epipterygia]|nr:hypothetical protein C8R44DRAFT_931292 [Mycena epipterygia]
MVVQKNIIIVGGTFARRQSLIFGHYNLATYIIDDLAPKVHKTHHVIMIEKNSHMQHLFAFPRMSVVPGFEHKAFIPFTNAFHETPRHSTSIVKGVALRILPDKVVLARGGKTVIVGGGAFSIQMAFDAKEFYPFKSVTLIHSRTQLLNRFHPKLHSIVAEHAAAVGVNLILGQRVNMPSGGFPISGPSYNVELADGGLVPADVAVACIGAVPLSAPLLSLSPSSVDPHSKFILVKPTLQIVDPAFPKVFSIGEVAATGGNKAAVPGYTQAGIATQNIVNMIAGSSERVEYVPAAPGIHLAVGLHSYVTFYNPSAPGEEPTVRFTELGDGDSEEVRQWYECRCHLIWERRAPGVTDYYS